MTSLVVDASVVAKWFLPEQDSAKAVLIRAGSVSGKYRLLAPDLLLSEFANVLWKNRNMLGETESVDMIRELLSMRISLIPSTRLVVQAYDLGRQHGRTVYDSMYLALAQSRDCSFVTADRHLFNSVSKVLPFVYWLPDWEPEGAA